MSQKRAHLKYQKHLQISGLWVQRETRHQSKKDKALLCLRARCELSIPLPMALVYMMHPSTSFDEEEEPLSSVKWCLFITIICQEAKWVWIPLSPIHNTPAKGFAHKMASGAEAKWKHCCEQRIMLSDEEEILNKKDFIRVARMETFEGCRASPVFCFVFFF